MDIKINLLKTQSPVKINKFVKYGLTILIIIVIFAQFKYGNWNSDVEAYNLIIPIFWTIWGIGGIYQIYSGNRIEGIFGKAYIHINDEFIKLKPNVFAKEKSISWKNGVSIENKPTYLEISDKNGEILRIDFKNFEYSNVQKIKNFIDRLINSNSQSNSL